MALLQVATQILNVAACLGREGLRLNELPSFTSEVVQASRILRVASPLGEDVLLPERARISEGVNRLFEIEVAVRSK